MQGPPSPDQDPFAEDVAIFSEINITPLTDVFLVLLIIFMVVASSEVDVQRQAAETRRGFNEKVMDIEPPQGAGSGGIVPKDVVISVNVEGEVFLDGSPVTLDDLPAALDAARKDAMSCRVVVRGDKEVQYNPIIQVISVAKARRCEVSLATRGQ